MYYNTYQEKFSPYYTSESKAISGNGGENKLTHKICLIKNYLQRHGALYKNVFIAC